MLAMPSIASGHAEGINEDRVWALGREQGAFWPEDEEAFAGRVHRARLDMATLRHAYPDWAIDLDEATTAYNDGDIRRSRAAFERLQERIDPRDDALASAQILYIRAALFHPFRFGEAERMFCQAAVTAPDEARYWIDCGYARLERYDREGAVLAFETALEVADGTRPGDYAVARFGVGDVRRGEFDTQAALANYEAGLAILRDLYEASPEDEDVARAYAWGLSRLGAYQGTGLENFEVASGYLMEALHIRSDLSLWAPSNASLQREYGFSLERIGRLRERQHAIIPARNAIGDWSLIAYEQWEASPEDVRLAWDAADSLELYGDLEMLTFDFESALAAYEDSAAIRRFLMQREPNDGARIRRLGLVLNSIGEAQARDGDHLSAMSAYEEGLALFRRLLSMEPSSSLRAQDVLIGLERIGDNHMDLDDPQSALAAYEEGHALTMDMLAQDPEDPDWMRALAISYWRLANADTLRAVSHWTKAIAVFENMQSLGVLSPEDHHLIGRAQSNLEAARGR